VSRLSRQCGILNISQPYRPRRPVTGLAFYRLYCSTKQLQAWKETEILNSTGKSAAVFPCVDSFSPCLGKFVLFFKSGIPRKIVREIWGNHCNCPSEIKTESKGSKYRHAEDVGVAVEHSDMKSETCIKSELVRAASISTAEP
jgi:hypothetical protein